MARYIDADTLTNGLKEHFDALYKEDGELLYSDHICTGEDVSDLIEFISKQPTADVIELPCKLGSEIYMFVTRHTKSFVFEENKKMVMRENQHTIIKPTTFTKSNFFKVIEEFGKTVFLTREEAEQKLREYECNDR